MLFMQMSQLSGIVKLSNNELEPNLFQINKDYRKFGHECKYLLTWKTWCFVSYFLYSYFWYSSKLSILQKVTAKVSSSYCFGLEKYSYFSRRVFVSKDWMANNKDPCGDLSLKPRTMMRILIFSRLDSYPLIKFRRNFAVVSHGRHMVPFEKFPVRLIRKSWSL